MADDIVVVPPGGDNSFGSMTRERLMEVAANPRLIPIDSERGTMGGDPLGHHMKLSQVQAGSTTAQQPRAITLAGQRAYHRVKKEEGTILETPNDVMKSGYIRFQKDDGTVFKALIKNITLL